MQGHLHCHRAIWASRFCVAYLERCGGAHKENFRVILHHPQKLCEGGQPKVLVQCFHTSVYVPVYWCHLEQALWCDVIVVLGAVAWQYHAQTVPCVPWHRTFWRAGAPTPPGWWYVSTIFGLEVTWGITYQLCIIVISCTICSDSFCIISKCM